MQELFTYWNNNRPAIIWTIIGGLAVIFIAFLCKQTLNASKNVKSGAVSLHLPEFIGRRIRILIGKTNANDYEYLCEKKEKDKCLSKHEKSEWSKWKNCTLEWSKEQQEEWQKKGQESYLKSTYEHLYHSSQSPSDWFNHLLK